MLFASLAALQFMKRMRPQPLIAPAPQYQAIAMMAATGMPQPSPTPSPATAPAQAPAPAPGAAVDVSELLSCCVDACRRAGTVIRAVDRARQRDGEMASARLKDASDTRSYLTEADTAAQDVIVSLLRAAYPGLPIVGEEVRKCVPGGAGG